MNDNDYNDGGDGRDEDEIKKGRNPISDGIVEVAEGES